MVAAGLSTREVHGETQPTIVMMKIAKPSFRRLMTWYKIQLTSPPSAANTPTEADLASGRWRNAIDVTVTKSQTKAVRLSAANRISQDLFDGFDWLPTAVSSEMCCGATNSRSASADPTCCRF
jgi:hypothetical protein